MREIKFRGKRVDNGEWVYGYYIVGMTGRITIKTLDEKLYEVIPETVGQYIEILDAYEGDVLWGEEKDEYGSLMGRWRGVVNYDDVSGRAKVMDGTGNWDEVDDFMFNGILGNIHDNPVLLEDFIDRIRIYWGGLE